MTRFVDGETPPVGECAFTSGLSATFVATIENSLQDSFFILSQVIRQGDERASTFHFQGFSFKMGR
jgi:hypothetical protein